MRFNDTTTIYVVLNRLLTTYWFNPDTTLALLTTLPQMRTINIHRDSFLFDVGFDIYALELPPALLGSIAPLQKVRSHHSCHGHSNHERVPSTARGHTRAGQFLSVF